jgi:hypothetical protein
MVVQASLGKKQQESYLQNNQSEKGQGMTKA